jgi:hypothetical protein
MLDFSDADPHAHYSDDARKNMVNGQSAAKPRIMSFAEKRRLIEGYERTLLAAMGIVPSAHGHIRCIFPDHEDRDPSWRWDDPTARYHCTCDPSSGDILDVIQRMGYASKASEALDWAINVLGLQDSQPRKAAPANAASPVADPAPKVSKTLAMAQRRWAEGQPIGGTLAERYLRAGRGLDKIALNGADMRFHPDLWCEEAKTHYPALIVLVRDASMEPIGIQRIWLDPNRVERVKVDKKSGGSISGGAFYNRPPADGHLGIAEGPETALAVEQIFGVPCAATLSASNMPGFVPPECVRRITIYPDADKPGREAADKTVRRLRERGCEVTMQRPFHGDDFSDDLRKGAKASDYPEPEASVKSGWSYDDFLGYLPKNQFICVDTTDLWPAASVNAQLPPKKVGAHEIPASQWIARHQAVQQMSWVPGQQQIIEDKIINEGGFIDRKDARIFNLYRPPETEPGDPDQAGRWLDHVREIYPDECDHMIKWFACRIQRPGEKINHALVLGGVPGIGKDTILEPVKYAVGRWNVQEIAPEAIIGRFNGFARSVILCISELKGQTEIDAVTMYEKTKTLIAAPPEVIRLDEKNLREYSIPNLTGVLQTTNNKGAIFLPPDDRRHFIGWSHRTASDFPEQFWLDLWAWYRREGFRHVAAYLRALDLSTFNPKAPPPKTQTFHEIVEMSRPTEDSALAALLDWMERPVAVTVKCLLRKCALDILNYGELSAWLNDRGSRKKIPKRLDGCGYVRVNNDDDERDGQFGFGSEKRVVFGRKDLTTRERTHAAEQLAKNG